jgi:hypothetical protein
MCRDMVTTINAFSETTENEDMGKVQGYTIYANIIKSKNYEYAHVVAGSFI